MSASGPLLIRHEGHTPRERSTCGWRDRLISREDADLNPAAWAHAVDIDGAKLHYHQRSTELYYVLEGGGSVMLAGVSSSSASQTSRRMIILRRKGKTEQSLLNDVISSQDPRLLSANLWNRRRGA
jgi:hypothetical protein